LASIEEAIMHEIDEAEAFAENSAFPPASELFTDNYQQADYPYIRD
jgi:pyruvate dehydrogenase E1 component alpha subunit